MHSLSDAARFIDASDEPAQIKSLLTALGFSNVSRPLDSAARDRLAMPETVLEAMVARGPGSLRAMTLDLTADADLRPVLTGVARELSARVPHLLWLLVATQRDRPTFAVAAWRSTAHGTPRVLTLVTERGRVLDSDAETLCALAACANVADGDVMRHLRWLDVLGREAITRRFFSALEHSVATLSESLASTVPATDAREMALLTTTRLVFLAFLETKGWLDDDFGFLANGFASCMATGGGYQKRVLEPLFFGTLNTRVAERAVAARRFGRIPFLNGGLFARSHVERLNRHSRFSDEALGELFGNLLVRFRFTPREDASAWSEAAIDPEILGKAFESLMAASERKRAGVYYTPQAFVELLSSATLSAALGADPLSPELVECAMATGSALDPEARDVLLRRTDSLRVLDPACGSGAFLVHVLERISTLRASLGDPRPISVIRRSVLGTSIHGVDINPTAIWLCQLRLWLATVTDSDERDPMRVLPLPNLDRQLRVGDSLQGPALDSRQTIGASHPIATLRRRYGRATGPRKVSLGRALDRAERSRAIQQVERAIERATAERREIVCAARGHDLFRTRNAYDANTNERLRDLRADVRSLRARRGAIRAGAALPFSYAVHFAEAAESGGFDMIIGNPPWIRIHNIPAATRELYRDSFQSYHGAAWERGAAAACAGAGFAGQVDTAALFVERSCDLLAHGGTLGLLLPSKLWRSLAGGGARRLLMDRTCMRLLEDRSDAPSGFDAAVYPSLLVAVRSDKQREGTPCDGTMTAGVRTGQRTVRWCTAPSALPLDDTPGSPWLLMPPEVRRAFDMLSSTGQAMAHGATGRPWLGVKTGCNAAFVVRETLAEGRTARIDGSGIAGTVERGLLRPLVRGETLTPWTLPPRDERIIWTHGENLHPLRVLPPHASRWFATWRRTLERRSDARGRTQWWSLFRVEAADSSSARVVWNDFGFTPRAAVLLPGDDTVPLNTCYVARCPTTHDALTLAALINSPLVAAWLAVLAEPARGGYRRYMGWTLALLPLPREWNRACSLLGPLAERAMAGDVPPPETLHHAVLAAYGLQHQEVEPLLAWAHA